MQTIDFSRSYLRFYIDFKKFPAITLSHNPPTTQNEVRISAECRCRLTNRKTGVDSTYVLGASCKTERVGAERDLWLLPNADFCLTASTEEFLIVKNWQKKDMGVMRVPASLGVQPERQVGLVKEAWTRFSIDVKEVEARECKNVDEIVAATRGIQPMVSRTEFTQGDWTVVIEHPVKTMNISDREGVFQTDTGPILLPDLSPERLKREEKLVGCFDLAFSALNAPGFAEFIVLAPTKLSDSISVNHYSVPKRIDGTKNSIIEVV